jgi:hypothetical protein
MALQDDIMSMLSNIGDAGDLMTSRGNTGAAMIPQLSPEQRSWATALYDHEQFNSLEEAAEFDSSIGNRIMEMFGTTGTTKPNPSSDIEEYIGLLAGEKAPFESALQTPVDVTNLDPVPVDLRGQGPGEAGMMMVDDNAAAMQGQGMDEIREELMSAPTLQRSLNRLQEAQGRDITFGDDISRKDLEAAEADYAKLQKERVIETAEKQARQEGVYGSQAARIRAAAGENTGLSAIELSGRTGREATADDEVSAIIFGATAGTSGPVIGQAISKLAAPALSRLAMRLGIGRVSPQELVRNPVMRKQIEHQVRLALPKPTPGAPSSYVSPASRVGARTPRQLDAVGTARAAERGGSSGPPININQSPAQRLGSTKGSGSRFDNIINRQGGIGMAQGGAVRKNIRDKIMNTYGRM